MSSNSIVKLNSRNLKKNNDYVEYKYKTKIQVMKIK